ncbi:MAG: 1-deoxy-D-xylulose-5-phosphate synthase [Planctomycetota bacterium]|jgi:1-deoxy-D-xylulose-5-phosphate synthase
MSKLLEHLNSPTDLKKLSIEDLGTLAEEMRDFIVRTVSKTGGHLSSNLGVVELTIAMHYVFDFKSDKLLWDVGHQCYSHKIITGRKDKFALLRQADGPSGFPNPDESSYDQFCVGHAGTAISTAIGMALGEVQRQEEEKIVAVVGDGSIVNGVSFEALNNLGLVKRQLLIVLNDNSMAIDPTQGAVAKYFSKIRLSHTYEDIVRTTNNILEHLPVIGKGVEEALERIKKSIRMALPPSQIFESLNIPYFGPVDGHDIKSLVQLFKGMAHMDKPAILHVYTRKGKGFSPAEEDRGRFHSTGPFERNGDAFEPGESSGRRSFTEVFGEHLVKLAKNDHKIVAITCAMCDGTGLGRFRERFSERFYDVGIAESAAVDIAAGMAKAGCKPVVCIYSTFIQRSFDQIFQEVALQNLPVVFCIDRAGLVGPDGPTHHGLMDIGFLRPMANMVVLAPADEVELQLALEFALSENKPVAIRYPKDTSAKISALQISNSDWEFDRTACSKPFELGTGVVVRKSKHPSLTIISYGSMLAAVIKAAGQLFQEGIEVDVINARFVAPIDEKWLFSVCKGKGIVTVEDHAKDCGFGSAVLEAATRCNFLKPVTVLGVPKKFIKHNSRDAQLMEAGLNADKIAQAVKKMVESKS